MNEEREVLRAVLTWAEQRCPCKDEQASPCPLCGASVENLEPCKSAEDTMPIGLLREIRRVLSPTKDAIQSHGKEG